VVPWRPMKISPKTTDFIEIQATDVRGGELSDRRIGSEKNYLSGSISQGDSLPSIPHGASALYARHASGADETQNR